MEYPILIDGKPAGTLTETAEGLYTVFRADCGRRDGLIRLWLHGGGQSVPLGLLVPRGERLTLTRRLSRIERRRYPSPVEEVSDRPGPSGKAALPAPALPAPVPPVTETEAEEWTPLPDGSLAAKGRIALPACLPPRHPFSDRLLRIRDREYLVFRL